MRRILFLGCFLLPAVAAAQTTTSEDPENDVIEGMNVLWTRPSLGKAACDAPAEDIKISVALANTPVSPLRLKFFAWWETGNATCTGDPTANDNLFGSFDFPADDPFVTATLASIIVPDQLQSGGSPALTTASVLAREDACTKPLSHTTIKLCFGLDIGDTNLQQTNIIDANELHGWVRFIIDTKPPPAPNAPEVTPLDGALSVKVTVPDINDASVESGNLGTYFVRFRPLPTNDTVSQTPDMWDTANEESSTDASGTVTISGTNGVTYQLAAYVRDTSDNASAFSAVVEGAPRPESDFAKSYPAGELKPGCKAAGATPLASLLVLLGLCRRRRSRTES